MGVRRIHTQNHPVPVFRETHTRHGRASGGTSSPSRGHLHSLRVVTPGNGVLAQFPKAQRPELALQGLQPSGGPPQ
jgi:hypothetical protein